MEEISIHDKLAQWVKDIEGNGISQGTEEWLIERVNTMSGSILSSIMGCNRFSSSEQVVREKIGFEKFKSSIKPQWGKLFEPVIKTHVEMAKCCKIIGENIYIRGPNRLSYSPDGLGVMMIDGAERVVLFEFKCPYSRIPAKKAPVYYIPQVKMGLELIELSHSGLLAEAVFRRCSWEQLGDNSDIDLTLVPKPKGSAPIALGLIGFYMLEQEYLSDTIDALLQKFSEEYGAVTSQDTYDIGSSSVELFTLMMTLFDQKLVIPWYGQVHPPKTPPEVLNKELAQFTEMCIDKKYKNLGLLPWKLLHVEYHHIDKEPGYLQPYMDKINEILDLVEQCNSAPDYATKQQLYNNYFRSGKNIGGFSDEM